MRRQVREIRCADSDLKLAKAAEEREETAKHAETLVNWPPPEWREPRKPHPEVELAAALRFWIAECARLSTKQPTAPLQDYRQRLGVLREAVEDGLKLIESSYNHQVAELLQKALDEDTAKGAEE